MPWGEITQECLFVFAQTVHAAREREAGRTTPARYDKIATCDQRGPVWLDIEGSARLSVVPEPYARFTDPASAADTVRDVLLFQAIYPSESGPV